MESRNTINNFVSMLIDLGLNDEEYFKIIELLGEGIVKTKSENNIKICKDCPVHKELTGVTSITPVVKSTVPSSKVDSIPIVKPAVPPSKIVVQPTGKIQLSRAAKVSVELQNILNTLNELIKKNDIRPFSSASNNIYKWSDKFTEIISFLENEITQIELMCAKNDGLILLADFIFNIRAAMEEKGRSDGRLVEVNFVFVTKEDMLELKNKVSEFGELSEIISDTDPSPKTNNTSSMLSQSIGPHRLKVIDVVGFADNSTSLLSWMSIAEKA